MEVDYNQTYWLDEQHPNFKRWEKAREISFQRGTFVNSLISEFKNCRNLKILDLGSGEGGTSEIFSDENYVLSIDLNKIRLNRQNESINNKICCDISTLPFKKKSFDLIIMQDVIEHLDHTKNTIKNISALLNDGGMIYLSTPNRNSIINLLADPHWSVPFVSLFKRDQTKKYFLRFFRKTEINRKDIAELLSLKKIYDLFSDQFEVRLNTTFVLTQLFNGNPGIIWSKFHILLTALARKSGLSKLLLMISNDKKSFVNNYLTTAFYLILIKKEG